MGEVEEVDRISNLADALLSEILSYLSTEEAVATCILSKRWISVWTIVPVLQLSLNDDHSEASENGFKAFVDRVLLCNDSPSLRVFQLSGIPMYEISDIYYHSWIRNIMRRDIVEIDLSLEEGTLPAGFFSSETLIVLKLWGFNLPLKNPVHLPNLLTLHFKFINITDELFFKDFLMSLPRLQELVISECYGLEKICIICSSSLKRLTIKDTSCSNVIVSAPSLEYLYIDHHTSDNNKFCNMPSLAEAKLYMVKALKILQRRSNVVSLELVFSTKEAVLGDNEHNQLPLFPHLKRSVNCLNFSWRHLVLSILMRAPNLISLDY